jgi:hypothetical protein
MSLDQSRPLMRSLSSFLDFSGGFFLIRGRHWLAGDTRSGKQASIGSEFEGTGLAGLNGKANRASAGCLTLEGMDIPGTSGAGVICQLLDEYG